MKSNDIFNYVEKANTLMSQAKEAFRDNEIAEAYKRVEEAHRIKRFLRNSLPLNKGAAYEVLRDAIGSLSF